LPAPTIYTYLLHLSVTTIRHIPLTPSVPAAPFN
jgi:hypothetical protein